MSKRLTSDIEIQELCDCEKQEKIHCGCKNWGRGGNPETKQTNKQTKKKEKKRKNPHFIVAKCKAWDGKFTQILYP